MMTFLHAVQWPLACLCGYLAGAAARRRKLPWWGAYAVALLPGVLIAVAAALFGPEHAASNEQPWQGFAIWAPWAGLGLFAGFRGLLRARLNSFGLNSRGPR
jgi:membrane protease YdiL (CAAX protease family)